jgi:hypothetical protein
MTTQHKHGDCPRADLLFLDILWARASAGGYSQLRALRLRIAYPIQENTRNWGEGLVAWLTLIKMGSLKNNLGNFNCLFLKKV